MCACGEVFVFGGGSGTEEGLGMDMWDGVTLQAHGRDDTSVLVPSVCMRCVLTSATRPACCGYRCKKRCRHESFMREVETTWKVEHV